MDQKTELSPKTIAFIKKYRFPLRLVFVLGYVSVMDFIFSLMRSRIAGDSFIQKLILSGLDLCMILVIVVSLIILFDPILRKNQDISK